MALPFWSLMTNPTNYTSKPINLMKIIPKRKKQKKTKTKIN